MNRMDPPPLGRLLDCQSRVRREFQDFVRDWAEVKKHWKDAKCDEFEKTHLAELPRALTRVDAALQDLNDTIQRVEKQLADEAQMGDP
ncbi:MAG: hypothetical protein AAF958_11585 [Planctomycetota bacterium]